MLGQHVSSVPNQASLDKVRAAQTASGTLNWHADVAGEASPQPQPSSTLKGLPSTSQTQPGSDAQPNGNIAKPPQASKQAIPTPEQTDATAAAAQQSVASLSNADVPVTNGHSMGSQQGLKLEPAVMKKRTEKPKQPATQQHAKADVAAQQADVVLSEAAQHITEVAVKSDYAAAAPAVAAPASAVGKLHAVSSSVLPVTSTEPQQPEHEDPDLIWANSTLGSNALQVRFAQRLLLLGRRKVL